MKNTFLTYNEIYEKLKPQLNELDALRMKWRQKEAWTLLYPALGLAMIIIGLYFFEVEVGFDEELHRNIRKPDLPMLGLTFVGIMVFILTFAVRNVRLMQYKDFYKDQFITRVVGAIDPSFICRPKSFIERITFMRANFLPHDKVGAYSGKNLIKGNRGATDFRFSEVKVRDTTENILKVNFKGLFFEADFHKHFQGRTIIKPRKWLDILPFYRKRIKHIDVERIQMEDVRFERKFTVYTDDQVEARYILTTRLMDDLTALSKRLKCKMYVSFLGDNMYLAINWKKKLFSRLWTRSANNEDLIYQYYEDLTFCLNLVDDLNLNTRIWSKRP